MKVIKATSPEPQATQIHELVATAEPLIKASSTSTISKKAKALVTKDTIPSIKTGLDQATSPQKNTTDNPFTATCCMFKLVPHQ